MESKSIITLDDHELIISTLIILITCVLGYILYRNRRPQTISKTTQTYLKTQKDVLVQTETQKKDVFSQTKTRTKDVLVQTESVNTKFEWQQDVKKEIKTTSRKVKTESVMRTKSTSRTASYRTHSDDSDEDNGGSNMSTHSPRETHIRVRARNVSIGDGSTIQCTDSVNSNYKNNLLVSTKVRLEQNSQKGIWVERSGLYAVINCLTNHNIAIITGVSGDGKSTLALAAMSRMLLADDRRQAIIVKDPLKWDEAISLQDEHLVVFIDDIFGESYFRQDIYENMKKHFSDMLLCVRRKKIILLIACKTHILEEALQSFTFFEQETLATLFSKEYTVDLSVKYKLTETEREAIVYSHIRASEIQVCDNSEDETAGNVNTLRSNTIAISKSTISEICKIISPPSVGFPQVCRLFFSRKEFLACGQSFFKKPGSYLINDLYNMQTKDRDMYNILVACLLQEQNLLNINDLSNIKTITSTQTLRTKIKVMEGVYLTKMEEDVFTFSHKSIMESILFVHGNDAPEDILTHCSDQFLSEFAVCQDDDDSERVFFVRQQHYQALFDRILEILQTGGTEPLILSSGRVFLSKEFTKFFFKTCKEKSLLNKLVHFRYDVSNVCSENQKKSILFFSANSPYFLKCILKYLNQDDLRSSYFQGQLELALEEALRNRNKDAIETLLLYKANVSSSSIKIAGLSDKREILELILESCYWTPEQLTDALRLACEEKCVTSVGLLLKEEVDFSKCLLPVVLLNDEPLVKTVLSKQQWTIEDLREAIRAANKLNLWEMASFLHRHYKQNI